LKTKAPPLFLKQTGGKGVFNQKIFLVFGENGKKKIFFFWGGFGVFFFFFGKKKFFFLYS